MIELIEARPCHVVFRSTKTGRNFVFAPGELAEFATAIKGGALDDEIAINERPAGAGRGEQG